jgi:hypothetical protein
VCGALGLGEQAPQLEPQAPVAVVCRSLVATKAGSGQRSKASFKGCLMTFGASVSRQYTVQPATRIKTTRNWKTSNKKWVFMVVNSAQVH